MDFSKIIARVKNILLTPKTEWPVIAAEPDTVAGLYKNYILILAAIPAIIGFLRFSRWNVGSGLTYAILSYAITLIVVYLVAMIVNALAPTFGGTKNQVQAVKAVAYSYTASWVASIATIVPVLGWLVAIAGGIYSIYLLYLGLSPTMKVAQEKAGGYTAVTVILTIVFNWILGVILIGALIGGTVNGLSSLHSSSSITPDTPLAPDRDSTLGALAAMGQRAQEASKKMEAAQKSGDTNAQAAAAGQMLGAVLGGGSQVEALTPDALKPFVPDSIAGLPRTSLEVKKQAPIGVQISVAEADYGAGSGPSYHLTVSDMGGAKGIMGLAGFANLEEEKQTDHGYEKTYRDNGRLVHEEWSNSGSGEYTVVLGDRFIVGLKGSGIAGVDALKSAVASLNLAGLEALKSQGVKKG